MTDAYKTMTFYFRTFKRMLIEIAAIRFYLPAMCLVTLPQWSPELYYILNFVMEENQFVFCSYWRVQYCSAVVADTFNKMQVFSNWHCLTQCRMWWLLLLYCSRSEKRHHLKTKLFTRPQCAAHYTPCLPIALMILSARCPMHPLITVSVYLPHIVSACIKCVTYLIE